ncbi:MAG TPA: SCO family protein [Rudaea sp.]|nr:SCO family protein [Rudaea sp.]
MKRLFVLTMIFVACAAAAQPPQGPLADVGFDQRLGAAVPLDAVFLDEEGRTVRLRDLVHDRPVLLALGYYGCTNVCGPVRDGIARAVAQSSLTPGVDFDVVYASIDAAEKPALARASQRELAERHPAALVTHWHFLAGASTAAVDTLAAAIGFHYRRGPADASFAHPVGIVILTPQGIVSRYFFGVGFDAQAVRLALVDASGERIGSLADRLLLLCCGFDEQSGRYNLLIGRLLKIAAAVCLVVLGAGLALLERRRQAAP